jgi:uncharacterized protein involved in exopolysaccharide biosynthesis
MADDSSAPIPTQPGFSALAAELLPILAFIRRWWILAVSMTLLTSLTTLLVVSVKGVEYQVSAALFYKLGPELAPPPTMGKDSLVITRRAEDVNDEIEILTSPDLVHEVVQGLGDEFFKVPLPTTTLGKVKRALKDTLGYVTGAIEESMIQLGLRRRLTKLEKIELAINKKLKVELVRESDVISLTLNTPSPEAGVVIVRKLLDTYQARHLVVHQEIAVKEFLTRQTKDLRAELSDSMEKLLEFQTLADLWSPDEQQKLLLDNRKSLQMQVAATSSHVAHLGSFVESLSATVEQLPAVMELSRSQQFNPAIIDLQDRLASLDLNQAVVETAYRAGTRESDDRRQQIVSLRKKIEKEPEMVLHTTTTGVNENKQALAKEYALKSAELKGLRDQLAIEQQQLAAANEALQKLGSAISKFQHLQREHRLLEQKYALYSENYEKADISAVMNLSQISNMELISPPMASMEPVSPRLYIVAAIGILSGLISAFVLAVAFDLRGASRARIA